MTSQVSEVLYGYNEMERLIEVQDVWKLNWLKVTWRQRVDVELIQESVGHSAFRSWLTAGTRPDFIPKKSPEAHELMKEYDEGSNQEE